MRLFFALWPDDALRRELSALATTLQAQCGGRKMPPETLHLTLAFLGEVPEDRAARLVDVCERFRCPPGRVALDHLGFFPRGGVVWLGCRSIPKALEDLQANLWQVLATQGFAPPSHSFLPHITLLRKAREPNSERVLNAALQWHYNQLELIHSVADGAGRRYEVLAHTACQREN